MTSTTVVQLGAGLSRRPNRVALVGNPNVGKSSLFNSLTGLRQKVGNYPGVTVDRVIGTLTTPAGPLQVVDLPGTYSLAPRSPDERVARDELLGRVAGDPAPDVVVVVADAGNLARSLFLVSQVMELGCGIVIALNLCDVAVADGTTVDPAVISAKLGVPVVPVCGRTGAGSQELIAAILTGGAKPGPLPLELPEAVTAKAKSLVESVGRRSDSAHTLRRAEMLLTSAASAADFAERVRDEAPELASTLMTARAELAEGGVDVEVTAAEARYAAVLPIAEAATARSPGAGSWQMRIDRVLTHPVWGSLVLLGVFYGLFMLVYSWSAPGIDLVDGLVGDFGAWLGGLATNELLSSFLENGVVAGFGAFLVFVPQIFALFLFIEALEDSGYLARAAFLLDRVMGRFGLPGRAFLPLMSGFACAIPSIMAARTIENRRDRMVTMAIAPLMSCQARLPVYFVVVGAVFAAQEEWVASTIVLAMYLCGIVIAAATSTVLRRTVMRGARSPLLLELPTFRRPSARQVVGSTVRRTWSFVRGAGPIILVLTMALWVTLTFPRQTTAIETAEASVAAIEVGLDAAEAAGAATEELEESLAAAEGQLAQTRLRESYLGRAGLWMEPAIEPAGFDWKMGVAILGSFAAREVFVPTLGVIYGVGEADEEDEGLLASMRNDRRPDGTLVYTPLAAISLLVFYVIALQCMSTLAVLKRETNSWRWPIWLFVAYTVLAYVASLLIFQVGSAMGYA